MTNYHYSPAHRVIPKTFRSFLVWLLKFNRFFGNNSSKATSVIIGIFISYLFQMIGVLLFVEILIIGVFGINKNIEEEITKREMDEFNTRIEGLLPLKEEKKK